MNKDNKKTDTKKKKNTTLSAESKIRSAVDRVTARSTQDVRGANRLSNTGPTTTYENES